MRVERPRYLPHFRFLGLLYLLDQAKFGITEYAHGISCIMSPWSVYTMASTRAKIAYLINFAIIKRLFYRSPIRAKFGDSLNVRLHAKLHRNRYILSLLNGENPTIFTYFNFNILWWCPAAIGYSGVEIKLDVRAQLQSYKPSLCNGTKTFPYSIKLMTNACAQTLSLKSVTDENQKISYPWTQNFQRIAQSSEIAWNYCTDGVKFGVQQSTKGEKHQNRPVYCWNTGIRAAHLQVTWSQLSSS